MTEKRRLAIGLVASLAAHGLLVLILSSVTPERRTKDQASSRVPIAMKVIEKGRERDKKTEKVTGEVVDIPKPVMERVPAHARFLSRYNTATEREQKARGAHGRKTKRPSDGGASAGEQMSAHTAKPAGVDPEGKGLKLPPGTKGPAAGTSNEPTLHGLRGLDKLLLPTLDGEGTASRLVSQGMSGYVTDDAMLGVEEGDTTIVNSRSFKYWDFFQRVKERVRSEWNPGDVYRARDPYGKVYGTKDRLTVLGVVLDKEGRIVRVEVVRESGLPFLDQEAIRAMKEAAPFVNPPEGLADEKGRIVFNFGFLLELSSSRYRMFWRPPE